MHLLFIQQVRLLVIVLRHIMFLHANKYEHYLQWSVLISATYLALATAAAALIGLDPLVGGGPTGTSAFLLCLFSSSSSSSESAGNASGSSSDFFLPRFALGFLANLAAALSATATFYTTHSSTIDAASSTSADVPAISSLAAYNSK